MGKLQRVRELDEKYVSVIPYKQGRGEIMVELYLLCNRYRRIVSDIKPKPKNPDENWYRYKDTIQLNSSGFVTLIMKRWCSSHLNSEEYEALRSFVSKMETNILMLCEPNGYSFLKYEKWADEIAKNTVPII